METQTLGIASPETAAATQPGQSAQTEVQQPSIGDVLETLKGIAEKQSSFESQLRGLQGVQQKTNNELGGFRQQLAQLNRYKADGMSDEEALAEMEADNASNQRWQAVEQTLQTVLARLDGGGTAQNAQRTTTDILSSALSQYQLDPKDPYVAGRLAGQSPKTETEAELLAARIFKDQKLAPPTNPSQQSSTPANNSGAGVDYNALSAEYDALSKGDITDPAVFQRMTEIKKELDNLK